MVITNLVEAVLDRSQLKWDALWHLLAWLLNPAEGHGLQGQVLDALTSFALGSSRPECEVRREFRLGVDKHGTDKWPDLVIAFPGFQSPTHILVFDDVDLRSPGARRKLQNLTTYREIARQLYPNALTRGLVLTNARGGSSLKKLYEHLGAEALDCSTPDGWKLLPLVMIGGWVNSAVSSTPDISQKMTMFLGDFIAWTETLDETASDAIQPPHGADAGGRDG